ncbi:MAG: selenoneine biosynthesis selenosugar synthase SenB [Pirellulales bacterium]
MNITLVTPAPPGSLHGNRVTALRWAGILRGLGHRVTLSDRYEQNTCDLLVALHARRSARSVDRFHRQWPDKPLIVALTGTDVYADIHTSPAAARSLQLASRLVVLQPLAKDELPPPFKSKVRVIFQSAPPPRRRARQNRARFEVCVMGHLRPVKDPFRTALAARRLPAASRLVVLHLGTALTASMARRALREQASNPRYRWLGGLSRPRALARLARSRLLVVSSRLEGGANAVSEALAAGVPVVASRIPGCLGILGGRYPGYFPVGDTKALAVLLERAETDRPFYETLAAHCRRRAALVDPGRERAAWRALLAELFPGRAG